MLVRTLNGLQNSDRHVSGETWSSRRLLLQEDGMGFSLHDTIIHAGTRTEMHYQNHLEAVYCIEGTGSITDVQSGQIHPIEAGTMYALDQNDKHVLVAETTMRMICVFNPPLVGPETHDDTGAYPLLAAVETSATDKETVQ
jgi:L-ectoine synthase